MVAQNPHGAEAHLIRGYPESPGVKAILRGEFLTGSIGELPADIRKVWIIDDSELAHADALLRAFLQGEAARTCAHDHWRCTHCGEQLKGQFTACWNCGVTQSA